MKGWIVTLVVVVLLGMGYYAMSRPEKVAVSLITVKRGLVERTVANTRAGTIEACQRSRLSLPIGGQVDQLLVTEGDHVQQGQLLMTLWNKDRAARVNEAKAAGISARREQDNICISAKSDAREAKRLFKLAANKLVSAEVADRAASKAEARAAACEASKARALQALASIEIAEAVFAQTQLRAPFEGIVAEVTGELGEYSTPSPPGVATPPAIDLITDHCHYISAPIDEVDASEITAGLPVRVTMDAFRDKTFPATIERIAPYVLDLEKQARTVEVEARFDHPLKGIRLLAGYSADMEIILETHENTVRVPSELVLDNQFVLVVNDNDLIQKREVTLGLSNWRYTEIVSGLTAGEKVIANVGNKGVTDGARAEITEQSVMQDND